LTKGSYKKFLYIENFFTYIQKGYIIPFFEHMIDKGYKKGYNILYKIKEHNEQF